MRPNRKLLLRLSPAQLAVGVQMWQIFIVPVELRVGAVLGRENRRSDRPRDFDSRIVPRQPRLTAGIVVIRAFVLHVGCVAQDAKTVCESFGYERLAKVV